MISLHNDQIGRTQGISFRQVLAQINRILTDAVVTMELWAARARQRRQLASLDDRQLADIGRSYADAWQESNKPFWKK